MRSHTFFAIASGVAVSGLLAATPVFAQSTDQPIVATITVPVTIDFLDTEQMSPAPTITCVLYGLDNGPAGIVAAGSAPVPMVSTQATTTARSTSSFSGNVAVTLRSKLAGGTGVVPGGKETAAQAGARSALAAAKRYECALGSADGLTSGPSAGASAGPKWASFVLLGNRQVEPLKKTLSVKGTIAGK